MIENQLTELIAALNANTAALLAKAAAPVTETPAAAAVEPKPAKVKKEKLTVVEPEPEPELPDIEATLADEDSVVETRSPEELRLAITEQVKAALTAPDAITKNAKAKWEKVRTDHGIGKLAEATDDQLPSILAAVMAL